MYIGNDLQVAESGNKIIDDISSGFNGSETSFALTVGGYAPVPFPINTQQIYLSVNGVIQEPDPTGSAGFKLLGTNIVFSSAPANGHAFFGVILSGADYVTVGTEFPAGSATSPSITFGTDNDTGMYSVTAGQMGFTSDGVQTFTLDGDAFRFNDNKKLIAGTGSDLEIYHNGSDSYIKNLTGGLNISTDDGQPIYIRGGENMAETLAAFTDNGACEFYFDNSNKLQTVTGGINVTGTVVDDGATHDGDVTFTGASANVVWDKSEDDLIFNDNAKAVFGTGSDLQIYHNGSHSYIDENGAGIFAIRSNGTELALTSVSGESMGRFINDGAVELYYDNAKKFETTSTGVSVSGSVSVDAGTNTTQAIFSGSGGSGARGLAIVTEAAGAADEGVIFNARSSGTTATMKFQTNSATALTIQGEGDEIDIPDGTKLRFGDSNDLQIYHSGSNSFIDETGTGNLLIRAAEEVQIKDSDSSEAMGIFKKNGAVELYYNNDKKFETCSTGTILHKEAFITGVEDGDARLYFHADEGDDNADKWQFGAATQGHFYIQNLASGVWETNIEFNGNGNVELYYDNSKKFETTSGGATVTGTLESTEAIGVGESSPDVRLHVTETFNTGYTVDNATTESNNLLKLENPSSTANAFAGIAFRTGSGADMYFGSIQQSGNDGDFYFANQNSTNKELLRIKSTGDVNIADGNLIIGTSGHGIDFSATANSSGTVASELLADYEIGTWTPQLGGSGNSFTYHADCGGSYIKVGQLVTLLGAIRLTARSGSSQLTLHNFPFTVGDVSSGDSNHEGGVVTHYTDNSASGSHGPLGHCTSGSGSVSLSHQLSSGNGSALNADEIDATFVWRFMVTYPSA